MRWPWSRGPALVPGPAEPVTSTAAAFAGEPVLVLGRVPLDPAADERHGALFALPGPGAGEEDVVVAHAGHLLALDPALRSLPALRPGDVLVRAHEEARWVRRRFRTTEDLDAWLADPVGWALGEPPPGGGPGATNGG